MGTSELERRFRELESPIEKRIRATKERVIKMARWAAAHQHVDRFMGPLVSQLADLDKLTKKLTAMRRADARAARKAARRG